MITSNKKTAGLLTFDTKSLQITRHKKGSSTTYRATYELDIVGAMQAGVATVQITIGNSDDETSTALSSNVGTSSPQDVLDSILKSSSKRKDTKRNQTGNIVKKFKSDFTKHVSNEIASRIPTADRKTAEALFGKETAVETVSRKSLSKMKPRPILQTPMDDSTVVAGKERNFNHVARDLLLKKQLPPSVVGSYAAAFMSTEDALKGVASKKSPSVMTRFKASSLELQTMASKLIGKNSDVLSTEDLSTDQIKSVPVLSKIQKGTPISFSFTLSSTQLSTLENEFRIEVAAVDSSGNVLDSARCCVDHYEELKLSSPTAEPKESANGLSFGTDDLLDDRISEDDVDNSFVNSYDLGGDYQLDPDIQGAILESTEQQAIETMEQLEQYVENINVFDMWTSGNGPIDGGEPTEWVYAGTIVENIGATAAYDLSTLNTSLEQLSSMATQGTMYAQMGTIYRMVGRGSMSSGFLDIVPKTQMRHLSNTSFLMGPSTTVETEKRFTSVTAFLTKNGIEIVVGGVSVPCFVTLKRRDLTLREAAETYVNDGESQVSQGDGSQITFLDADVKREHTYEYIAYLSMKTGRILQGSGRGRATYTSILDNLVTIQTTEAKVMSDYDGNIDIRFDISSTIPETGVSAIASLLSERGLTNFFESDIAENREQLQQLIVHSIDRVDMTTGIVESFGVFTGKTFSDRSNQSASNVSKLVPNRKYRYVISALVRSTETMIPSVTRTVVDESTGKTYSFSPAKFLNPTTLSKGVLKSIGTTNDNIDLRSEFMAGFTGAQRTIEITTQVAKSQVSFATVSTDARGRNAVKWKAKGATGDIDHFIVIGEKLGMRTILGKVHGFSHNGSFEFSDTQLSRSAGDVSYSVVPVYRDFTIGKPITAGSTVARQFTRIK